MARIFTEGFELGTPQFDFFVDTSAGFAVHARSGSFVLAGQDNGRGDLYVSNETELYARFAIYLPSAIGSGYQSFFHFSDAIGSVIALQATGNNPIRVLFRGSLLTEDAYITPRLLKQNQWYLVEARYQFVDLGGGEYDLLVQVKIEGVLEVNKTIAINSGPPIELTRLTWTHTARRVNFDDIAVNTTDGASDNGWPGDGRIVAARPIGDVATVFMGSDNDSDDNYLLVNEAPPVNTTFVESPTSSDEDLYEIQDITTLRVGDAIKRVWVAANARVENAGLGDTLELGLKPDGTSSASWTETPPLEETYYQYKSAAYTVNPYTSSAWTEADIDDLQIGIKVP